MVFGGVGGLFALLSCLVIFGVGIECGLIILIPGELEVNFLEATASSLRTGQGCDVRGIFVSFWLRQLP